MILTAQKMEQALLVAGGTSFKGQTYPLMCKALGQAISIWARGGVSVRLSGVTTGVVGSGKVVGLLGVVPSSAIVLSALSNAGVRGQDAAKLAAVVSDAMGLAFATGISYSGNSIGVSSGVDVSSVVYSDSVALVSTIRSCMVSVFGSSSLGPKALVISTGVGVGVASLMQTAYTTLGTVAPIGAVGLSAAAGTSSCGLM
jgi:hypothetical protein